MHSKGKVPSTFDDGWSYEVVVAHNVASINPTSSTAAKQHGGLSAVGNFHR